MPGRPPPLPPTSAAPAPVAVQGTLDDLGTPLHEVTFVVVDLETTGGSPVDSEITEIGAVKVRGGEVLGEFQSLVRPRSPIPAFIQVLTGITDALVADAPPVSTVLPAFLEFAGDAVLVAHNARFDISFLRAAAAQTDRPWPGSRVLDTLRLARQVLPRGETPNHKLATLAAHFGTTTTPDHRALHDARATVDVLHALLGRVGSLGVRTWEELSTYSAQVTPARRRKRVLAEGLPESPGVYLFRSGSGEVLYVGTASNLRRRVRSYFTASEGRRRIAEMVALAESVDTVLCATVLEAQVRELRLIASHAPPYNRRSRHPERGTWVRLTDELFPRLSIVREVHDDAVCLGPFASRRSAEQVVSALHEALPLRQCTQRLGRRPRAQGCALGEMGRCGMPCTGAQSPDSYAQIVGRARAAMTGDHRAAVSVLEHRLGQLAGQERYEEAAVVRDRMLALVRAAARSQRARPLTRAPEVVAARRREPGGWEVVCVRYGRLAGTTVTPAGADPMPAVEALRAAAEVVLPPEGRTRPATAEETDTVLRWLEAPGTRLVHLEGQWSSPLHGAGSAWARLSGLGSPA